MHKSAFLLAPILLIFLVSLVHAEQTGTINITQVTGTFLTGLQGYTIAYCNTTSDCRESVNYVCLTDYDSESVAGTTGWCASAAQTSCAHNSNPSGGYSNTTTGSSFCVNDTGYRTCTSGNWSANVSLCSSAQICRDGACVSNSSSTSSSGGGSASASNASASFIVITAYPAAFNITQGDNISRTVNVTNGNTTQRNITLALSGINLAWYAISPSVIPVLSPGGNGSFTVNFSIPGDAELRQYNVTATVSTSNISVIDSDTFAFRVLPSNKTIDQQIKPAFDNYTRQIDALEARFGREKNNLSQENQAKIQNLISFSRAKLDDAKKLLDQGKYFESNAELQEVQDAIDSIRAALQQTVTVKQDWTLVTVLAVVVAVAAGIIAFLMWPAKEAGYSKETGWLKLEERKKLIDRLKNQVKKKKKEESYFHEYQKDK